jgi:hypothetical protein
MICRLLAVGVAKCSTSETLARAVQRSSRSRTLESLCSLAQSVTGVARPAFGAILRAK